MRRPRTAIVHYWLVAMRGGERVLERLLKLHPGADIITHVYDPAAVSDLIASHRIRTTFINNLPGAKAHYQKYLPLMPRALEQMDLSEYDLVISSESGPAKGVIVRPDAVHICYCHSPMRYLWDHYHQYRANANALSRLAMSAIFPALRRWDVTSAQGIDHIIANSSFIARRVRKSWGRSADVVHPPVDVAIFRKADDISDHYLWVGQMTPYKRADLVADAFSRLGLPLLMIGTGELAPDIARRAASNIRIVERLDYASLRQAYAECRALIFPAEEDFGIVPVEANAAGRPVIAFGRGGVRDSIVDEQTGLFFDRQEVDSLIEAVQRFERWLPSFEPDRAIANAQRFAPENFDAGISRIISQAMGMHLAPAPVARLVDTGS